MNGTTANTLYTPFYCEENVWQLAKQRRDEPGERFVLFISNLKKSCALWAQRAAPSLELPVVWDYHVILVERSEALWVYDLDTTLGFPISMRAYLAGTFPYDLRERFLPRFRIVVAERFLSVFASDRSHMLIGGRYQQPPPQWPCIHAKDSAMNLMRFVDMEAPFEGEVVDLVGLRDYFEL